MLNGIQCTATVAKGLVTSVECLGDSSSSMRMATLNGCRADFLTRGGGAVRVLASLHYSTPVSSRTCSRCPVVVEAVAAEEDAVVIPSVSAACWLLLSQQGSLQMCARCFPVPQAGMCWYLKLEPQWQNGEA